jgi:hypothetical protein
MEATMATDRAAVKSLLSEQGQEKLMERLEPFFQKADRGFYDLADRATALKRMTPAGFRVARHPDRGFRVECFSFDDLARQSEACRTQSIGQAVWDNVVRAAEIRLRQEIGSLYNERMDAYLGPVMRQRVGEVLWPALGFSLWHSFQKNRWDAASQKFKFEFRGLVIRTLEFYVGYSLAGDEETAAGLADLVDVLRDVAVIGRRRGTENVYITVVS